MRLFGASNDEGPERYFMVEYTYVEDAYYKRSKFSLLVHDSMVSDPVSKWPLVPVRDEHLAALKKLESQARAKVITAPLFPYTGSVFFVMSKAADAHAEVTKFVKADPYVKASLVDDFKVREFALTDK